MNIKDVSEDVKNSDIEYCIDEYVRPIEHRDILRECWFHKRSFEQLAEAHKVSVATIKRIMHEDGDRALLKATKMTTK